jgi:hypothetical protein
MPLSGGRTGTKNPAGNFSVFRQPRIAIDVFADNGEEKGIGIVSPEFTPEFRNSQDLL